MNPDKDRQVEYAKECLQKLSAALSEIDEAKNKSVNVFEATGTQNREVKHSAFLAWLLNPAKPHKLERKFIKEFLQKLILHKNNFEKALPAFKPNSQILALAGIYSLENLSDFIAADDLKVETEIVLSDNPSRMDIFICSEKAKTLMVIENKTFTSTHDEQLSNYENQVADRKDWKKIFVYLTPKGVLPTENGIYKDHWCVFSYKTVVEIVKGLLRKLPKNEENTKVEILLRDYIEMVDTNVLKENKELQRLCKQIYNEHKDAIEILLNYADNRAFKYCKDKIKNALPVDSVIRENEYSFDFFTENLRAYFERHNEDFKIDEKRVKCRYCLSQEGKIKAGICLDKDKNGEWSPAQLLIIKACAPNKQLSSRFFSLDGYSVTLVSEDELSLAFESIEPDLEQNINNYLTKINTFEKELLNL